MPSTCGYTGVAVSDEESAHRLRVPGVTGRTVTGALRSDRPKWAEHVTFLTGAPTDPPRRRTRVDLTDEHSAPRFVARIKHLQANDPAGPLREFRELVGGRI